MTSSTTTGAITSRQPPRPLGNDVRSEWMLDSAIMFLNHGCFGARPRAVIEAQQRWRERIEARPIELVDRQRDELLAEAKRPLAKFLGIRAEDFGFITNATGGVNAVLRSLRFEPGDELLTVNHVYNAVRMTMKFIADHIGVTPVETPLPFPLSSTQEIVECIERAITKRTKLVIIDHVTSPTATVFPVEQIISMCESRGVDVLIDGAHAPGMLLLEIESLGAAYYAGNLHKWVCAPMGTAFLWVRPDKQEQIHPLTISHFYGESIEQQFSWQGTRDISGWLSVPDALAYFEKYGWENVRQHNHAMARWVQRMLCEKLNVEPTTPLDGSMIGSMTTLPLPEGVKRFESAEQMQQALHVRYRFEVPIVEWNEQWWIRASCQIYNRAEEYERLADAVLELTR